MNKLFIAFIAVAAIGCFSAVTPSASAQCRGGGVSYYSGHGGYHGGGYRGGGYNYAPRTYSYRPRSSVSFSYGTPGYGGYGYRPYGGYNNFYRPSYGYGGYGRSRGGIGFSIGF